MFIKPLWLCQLYFQPAGNLSILGDMQQRIPCSLIRTVIQHEQNRLVFLFCFVFINILSFFRLFCFHFVMITIKKDFVSYSSCSNSIEFWKQNLSLFVCKPACLKTFFLFMRNTRTPFDQESAYFSNSWPLQFWIESKLY